MLNGLNVRAVRTKGEYDSLVLFLCKECVKHIDYSLFPASAGEVLQKYLAGKQEFWKIEAINQLTYIDHSVLCRIIIAGCGEGKDCSAANFRKSAGVVGRVLKKLGCKKAFAYAPILADNEHVRYLSAVTVGLYLGAYDYDEYKSEKEKKTSVNIEISSKIQGSELVIKKSAVIAEAVTFSRDLINKPGNEVYPDVLAAYAKKIAKVSRLQIRVLNEKDMASKKMNAILAVGQGSVHKPRMIILKYNGDGKNAYTAYVGKGITFDSGGISIKPSDGMGEMKDDMSGAAIVLGTIMAAAKLKLKINLFVVLACAENMPGGNAQRPGDIVRAANGKTIEVITTDAEGRMVLADAVWYACKLGAKRVIDIATLTGAAIIALGNETAALIANNDELATKVITAGKYVGEAYWQMPAFKEYHEAIKSTVADIKNSGGRAGGCITGGLFIGEFIEKGVDWVHLDIGGTSNSAKTAGFKPQGGTAFGLMTLVELVDLL